jgi:hypothetical protein
MLARRPQEGAEDAHEARKAEAAEHMRRAKLTQVKAAFLRLIVYPLLSHRTTLMQ